MAARGELSHVVSPILATGIFACLVAPAEAYDVGDGVAWLLAAVLSLVGVCACLGWYSRSRNRQF